MNFFRNRHFFTNRVYNYFGLSYTTSHINNKTKQRIYLTGKIDGLSLLLYVSICFFLSIGTSSSAAKHTKYAYVIGFLIFLGSTFAVLVKRHKLFKKLISESTTIHLYERELPSSLTPAHVRFLMQDGLVDELSLASTLLDLIDRDYLRLEYSGQKQTELKWDIFKKKDILLIRTDKPLDHLFEYEKYLLEWFLGYNDKKSITSEKLHTSLNKDVTDDGIFPSDKMIFFSSLVLLSFPLETYFNKVKKKETDFIYWLFVILGFLPISSYLIQALAVYSLGIIFFANPTYTLSRKGVNMVSSYHNLKKYLEDFGAIEHKSAQMVEIWNYYLTYSIALDIQSIASTELINFFGKDILSGTHTKEKRIHSTDEDLTELQMDLKKWFALFEEKRKEELAKYKR